MHVVFVTAILAIHLEIGDSDPCNAGGKEQHNGNCCEQALVKPIFANV
jgi:hypothetical protein